MKHRYKSGAYQGLINQFTMTLIPLHYYYCNRKQIIRKPMHARSRDEHARYHKFINLTFSSNITDFTARHNKKYDSYAFPVVDDIISWSLEIFDCNSECIVWYRGYYSNVSLSTGLQLCLCWWLDPVRHPSGISPLHCQCWSGHNQGLIG